MAQLAEGIETSTKHENSRSLGVREALFHRRSSVHDLRNRSLGFKEGVTTCTFGTRSCIDIRDLRVKECSVLNLDDGALGVGSKISNRRGIAAAIVRVIVKIMSRH